MGQAVRKPLTPVRDEIGMSERGLHPDVTIAHLDRADRHVVRPQVEGARVVAFGSRTLIAGSLSSCIAGFQQS